MKIHEILRLANHFQQLLPGFEPSGKQSIMPPFSYDKDGNAYWPCYYCKNPVVDKDGDYITKEEDIENYEANTLYEQESLGFGAQRRWVSYPKGEDFYGTEESKGVIPSEEFIQETLYEEGRSETETFHPERLHEIKFYNAEFYRKLMEELRGFVEYIRYIDDYDELRKTMESGEGGRRADSIKRLFDDIRGEVSWIYDIFYYDDHKEEREKIMEIAREHLGEYGLRGPYHYNRRRLGEINKYWYNYYYREERGEAWKKINQQVKAAYEDGARVYKAINKILEIANTMIGTKKKLITKQTVNYPICSKCLKEWGYNCEVPDCEFRSSDIEDDFLQVEIYLMDKALHRRVPDEKFICEKHAFKCHGCGDNYLRDPHDSFGEWMDQHGAQQAFGDDYCESCFSESFSYCGDCNEVVYTEDMNYDEGDYYCNNCYDEEQDDREEGVEQELSSDDKDEARAFTNSLNDDSIYYPLDEKTIEKQILPALALSIKKNFKSVDQAVAFILKRVQSKDAKAAITAEINSMKEQGMDFDALGSGALGGPIEGVIGGSNFDIRLILVDFFTKQLDKIKSLKEKYPKLKGFKQLPVSLRLERTPGHEGHSFAIYPTAKLLNYADKIMPGAKDAYLDILARRGHHRGALAYARFSKSNDNIVIDNLQTDLDRQSFNKADLNNKALAWWLTTLKKFWVPYMLNALREYGDDTNQDVFLTSFKMQKSKWRSIPERNKDVYERIPDMMGFQSEKVDVKPEDLIRNDYSMRRIAELAKRFEALVKL